MQNRTIEDYCRLINKLDSGEGIKSAEISLGLGLSKITVSLTLQKLVSQKYVEKEKYGRVRLSNKGRKIAKKMDFRHRVLETFLVSKIGMNKNHVHAEAHALEHAASDGMIVKLYKFLGRPKYDPHGRKIL